MPEQVGDLSPTSRDIATTRVSMSEPGKETEEMYHHMQLDPYLIRECNERMRAEVSKLRLEKRLRENRRPRPSWRFVLALRRMPPLPR